ncbi:DMT family transporter [soil metagenome]
MRLSPYFCIHMPPIPRSKYLPHLACLAVSLIYGANFTLAKQIMPLYIQPYGFILMRVTFATIMFWLSGLVVKETIARKDFPRLMACGLFGVALNQLWFFKGLSLTSPINASLLMIMTPILVLVFAVIGKQEQITWRKLIGIVLGTAGASAIILYSDAASNKEASTLGDLYVFLNAASYGTFLVIVKPLMTRYHPFTIIKWVFLFGLIPVIPAGYSQLVAVDWSLFGVSAWLIVIYVLLFTTYLAYALNTYAMRSVEPSVVGYYIYIQPIFATCIALALGSDQLTWIKIVAGLVTFAGVYLATVKPKVKVR